MAYLLLMLLPLAMAGGCLALRGQRVLVVLAGLATVLVQLVLLLQTSTGERARLLGVPLLLGGYGRFVLALLLIAVVTSHLLWVRTPPRLNLVPLALLLAALLAAAFLVQNMALLALLLFATGLISLLLAMLDSDEQTTVIPPLANVLGHLQLVALSGGTLFAGFGLSQSGAEPSTLGAGLLMLGLSLWAGVIPPRLPRRTATISVPGAGGLLVSVALPSVALLLGISLLQIEPALLANRWVEALVLGLIGLAIICMPLLAYGDPTRSVGLLLTAFVGQLALGLVLPGADGARGTLAGLPAYVLTVALFACAGAMLGPVGSPRSGSTTRDRIFAGIAMGAGLLLVLGPLPLGGWIFKSLLWQAARERGVGALLVIVFSQIALVASGAYMIWGVFQPPVLRQAATTATEPSRRWASLVLRGWVLVLLVLAVALGLLSDLLLAHVDAALAELRLLGGN